MFWTFGLPGVRGHVPDPHALSLSSLQVSLQVLLHFHRHFRNHFLRRSNGRDKAGGRGGVAIITASTRRYVYRATRAN